MADAIRQAWWVLWYLAASPRRLEARRQVHLRRPTWTVLALAAAWGLIQVALCERTFHLTWQARLDWLVPAAVCAAAGTLLLYRRGALALLDALPGCRRPWLRWPGLIALTAALTAVLNYAVRRWNPDWPTHLPPGWQWLWPRALYRAILLAPVWGGWAMLVLGRFHRPTDRTDGPTRRLAEAVSPIGAAAGLAVPLAASLVYLNFAYPWHVVPPAAAVLAALGGGTALVRLYGGLTRQAVLAANFLTQVAFLVSYLMVR